MPRIGKKPNPHACRRLAEHLLPGRHRLIQSFPEALRKESQRRYSSAEQLSEGLSDVVSKDYRSGRIEIAPAIVPKGSCDAKGGGYCGHVGNLCRLLPAS